jgi:hypothetical protein
MHPADRVSLEWETTFAAVAGGLAHAARQRGGVLMGDAAELHKLGSGNAWPRSALELERVVLPELVRQPGRAGCSVRPVGGAARGVWHVQAAPLPQPVAQAAARPVAVRPVAPVPPPRAVPAPAPVPHRAVGGTYLSAAAGLPIPTQAEYEKVKAAALAASEHRLAQRKLAIAAEKRAIEHANYLHMIRGAA